MKVVIIDDTQLNVTLLQHLARKLPDCESVCFTDPVAGLAGVWQTIPICSLWIT
jgi:putative two-component system response regulator